MKILIINLGTNLECFVSTSLITGLFSAYNKPEIYFVTQESTNCIFKYNKMLKVASSFRIFKDNYRGEEFDLLINLHPSFSEENLKINSKVKLGFNFQELSETHDILYGDKKTSKNIFQLYFNISGIKWHGESFNFNYYPKTKTKKNRTGLFISNSNLKHYVINQLELKKSKLWNIPFKQNFFKKIDEINKCSQVITDDLLVMNLSIFLRKNVFFLKNIPCNFKLEFFGSGFIFPVNNLSLT